MTADISKPGPTIFVIFGSAGDLAWRKLIPAIYSLYMTQWLHRDFLIIGAGHLHTSKNEYRQHLKEGVERFSRIGRTDDEHWKKFINHFTFMEADLEKTEVLTELARKI